jgi:hypothetical protein
MATATAKPIGRFTKELLDQSTGAIRFQSAIQCNTDGRLNRWTLRFATELTSTTADRQGMRLQKTNTYPFSIGLKLNLTK